MRPCTGTSAFVALLFVTAVTGSARAQAAAAPRPDSAPHFALFGGLSGGSGFPSDAREVGVSADLRWSPVPVPLRLTVSFNQGKQQDNLFAPVRGGQAALDLVMRPIPKKLGIQPYFLGGLGMATRAPYSGIAGCYVAIPCTGAYPFSVPRQTWAFASAGMGLDVGRVFLQLKVEQPVASQGPTLIPMSVGFRFWD